MNKMNEYRVIVETSVAIGYANSTDYGYNLEQRCHT